jgi:arylsulfatase A-like enzyme
MPKNEPYTPLGYEDALKDMSHYVNAVGYDDRWIGQILDVLDEEDVADETLVVLHGDHGISIPENDILASYYNPNVGCDHVPLVFSHPKLPPLQIQAPVSTVQILPTILDLLVETYSLSNKTTQAASDLIKNSEGNSLLRTAKKDRKGDHKEQHSQKMGKWQFVVMNPGRAMIGVRHADYQDWRLVVPVLANVVWRFTDIAADPREEHPTVNFDFKHLLVDIEDEHGLEAARWTEEAAFVARWWVEENGKRWQYGQYAASSSSSATA